MPPCERLPELPSSSPPPITPSGTRRAAAAALLAMAVWAAAGCGPHAPVARTSARWLAGCAQPAFDPDGPPDAVRWALERQLSCGLVERDSTGHVRLALADSLAISSDSLRWTFRLRAGLRFTDGTALTSAHVREALTGGLAREDHATRAWLLAAVRGVAQVRAGRALPPLGIATPDARTLVLQLAAPDRRLLERLSVPGVTTPWKSRTGRWADAVGVGPWRVSRADGERLLTLVAAAPVAGVAAAAETLQVRFASGAPRARTILRNAAADALWPLPPGLLGQPLPAGWRVVEHAALPARRLLLVLRADVPPTTKPDVRAALARAVNHEELLSALGARGVAVHRWLPEAVQPYDWPRLDPRAATEARRAARVAATGARARRDSYHVVLAFDADGAGAEVARALQGQWARAGHDAELRPLRGREVAREALAARAAQAQLVESQALLTGPEAELALLVLPVRGPAVGSYRTGWRTREFDRWVALPEPGPGFDPDAVQRVLAQDRVVLPLASLPWRLAIRGQGRPPSVHPAFGPGWTVAASPPGGERSR